MSRAGLVASKGGDPINPSDLEQGKTLLNTKLFVPSLRTNRVERPRLFDRMNSGLDKALILVSAPAGYGKTTLVSSWLQEIKIPSTWISLDESDNDPIRFLQYILSALHIVFPPLHADLLGVLQGAQPTTFEPLLNIIINEIAGRDTPFVLVLDDFHTIRAQPVLDMIAYLLGHIPPQMHLPLLSRTDPPLQFSHMRATNQMVDIRAEHLRFTRDEIASFLNEVSGLKLSFEEISAMEARTEGWIAGLQLAAVSMKGIDDVHNFVTAFTGSHYYIMGYLTEEVLKRQPERIRLFLLQTSILGGMCAQLCEAVVDSVAIEETNGQMMLDELERMNLFLIPLDDERRWFRYHQLFAEVLSRHLEDSYPQLPAELHRRASQWYEQNKLIPEAIQHSLTAGELDRAIRLIEQNGVLLLIRGEVITLLQWIQSIEPYARTHPWIYIFKAWAFALTGNLDRVNGMLQIAEELISALEETPEVKIMKGTIAAARAHQANVLGEAILAADFARQALEFLPDIDLVSRSLRTVATSLLGDASSMSGYLEEARQAYLEAAAIGQAAGDINLTIVLNSNLANILVEQGSLRQAARIYSETLQLATRPDGQKAIITGRVYVELSQIYYEWNRLSEAIQFVHQSLALCKQWGNIDLQAVSYIMLARLEHIMRHPDGAQEAIQAAEQLAKNYDLAPRYATWVEANLARLWIAQGDLKKASDLVQKYGITTTGDFKPGDERDPKIRYLSEPGYLVYLRLLLRQGQYDDAIMLSQCLLRIAEASKRVGRMIEVFALQALAFHGKKDAARAVEVLEKALSLAQPEGYIRVFLDEGEPMAKLLFQVKSQGSGRGYVPVLLSALGELPGTEALPAQLLVEPLTLRELEVLKLIESGSTNQDIANRLVISIPTVKRHISNLYGKLGAKNRTQAVSLGRELGLFK